MHNCIKTFLKKFTKRRESGRCENAQELTTRHGEFKSKVVLAKLTLKAFYAQLRTYHHTRQQHS